MPAKKPKLKLVYLEWEDAGPVIPDGGSWATHDEILEHVNSDSHIVHSVGWLVSRTKNHIIIAPSCLPAYRNDDDLFSSVDKIPAGWVRRIKYLKF